MRCPDFCSRRLFPFTECLIGAYDHLADCTTGLACTIHRASLVYLYREDLGIRCGVGKEH